MILANANRVTVKYLADKFNVSRKTIYSDLNTIILSGIPIIYGQDHKGTVTLLEGFNFPKSFKEPIECTNRPNKEDIYIKYVNHEQSMKHTLSLWEKFTQHRLHGEHTLDPTIFHSWIRCQRMNVPIYEVDPGNFLSPDCLKDYFIENALSKEMVKPRIFLNIFKHLGWYAMTYDKNTNLEYIINPVTNYERLYPQLGYYLNVNERHIGTNSIALALMENRTIITRGAEHYNKSFHDITSIAAPIYKHGELYGALNIIFIHTNVNPNVVHIVNSFARLYEALVLSEHALEKKEEKRLYDESIEKTNSYVPKIYGKSFHWKKVLNIADYFSIMPNHMAIVGEEGVGKSTIARYIHSKSTRKYAPCYQLDGNQVPGTQAQLKEHLFGTEKNHQLGLIEKTEGGILIIKNVHKLSKDIQKLIGRYIKTSKIKRIGGRKFLTFDVRIIFTMPSLQSEGIVESLKNEILLYLNIHPLRERKEDILDIYQGWSVDENTSKDIKLIKSQIEAIDPSELKENIKTLRELFIENNKISSTK
jgi:transcriptional regulator of acetoin/glycerol metabolism